MRTSDLEYYQNYYDDKGDKAYTGEGAKHTSRMLVFQDWLRSYLKPGAKVLDIGCGDAVFAELMPEFEWHGVDINTQKAEGRIPNDNLAIHDLMKPPYSWEPGTFDAIICSEVLEHLWDLRVVHKEAKRLLKRDGVYVISTPNFDWITNHLEHHQRLLSEAEKHWTFEHIRHYNLAVHKRYLNEAGFVIDKFTGADGHYCPIVNNMCRGIRDGLRQQGIEVPEERLHQMAGMGLPLYQHTIIISARKA